MINKKFCLSDNIKKAVKELEKEINFMNHHALTYAERRNWLKSTLLEIFGEKLIK